MGDLWIELKCYASTSVRDIAISRIRGIDRVRVDGPVGRHSPLVVTALAALMQADTVFELGRDTADTAWLLAHNLPTARVLWLHEGDAAEAPSSRGPGLYAFPPSGAAAPRGGDEAARIEHLHGTSTTFDLLPYSGTADFVYIEATGRCDDLEADTDAAFSLLSELGCIVWDGYTGDTCVYAYLNRLARELDGPIFHIRGTRLAFHSRWDIVLPEPVA